jgi:hypothetical protein
LDQLVLLWFRWNSKNENWAQVFWRPVSEATEDIRYLENASKGRSQGFLYGEVFRKKADSQGNPALYAPGEHLHVIAAETNTKRSVDSDKSGFFQMALPPGEYKIWIERAGKVIVHHQMVRVVDGDEQRLTWPPLEFN